MQNAEVARAAWKDFRRPGPNGLERRFAECLTQLLYTGDGSYWVWLPKLKCHKNPDFVLPGPEVVLANRGIRKVVEVFGDYWHSEAFTGKDIWEHEQEVIDAFLEVGIECLVIWESEFVRDPAAIVSCVANWCKLVG
jgi:hypothetical protein